MTCGNEVCGHHRPGGPAKVPASGGWPGSPRISGQRGPGAHHRFTVASIVSRRAGRTFSDLACGTGGALLAPRRRVKHDVHRDTLMPVASDPAPVGQKAKGTAAESTGGRNGSADGRGGIPAGADGLDPEAGEAGPRRRQRCRRQASGAALPSEDHSGYPVGAVFVVDDLADHPQHEDGEEN